MLDAYPTDRAGGRTLSAAAWIDLVEPSEADRTAFETAFALRVPTKEELAEIEATSRLRVERDALYMTAPLIVARENEPWIVAPTGFVLSHHVLMTVRAAPSPAFDIVIAELKGMEKLDPAFAFVRIIECLVDRMADLLEASSRDLDEASHVIGRTSERMGRVHYTLVCLDRMAKFTVERARDWMARDLANRLQVVSSDIASLVHFTEALVGRIQLLQDAATGLINIDQNDVIKVLTIASVVGIPPVLVVGVYGMNFKFMPELDWTWGYPYALAVMVVTAVVPLIWFKLKNWI
jgi:magnesium transporter